MNTKNPPVLLFANDGANPLGIARSLGRKGIAVSVLTESKPSILRASRYIKKLYYVESFHQTEKIKEQLESFLSVNSTSSHLPLLLVTNESHYTDLLPLNEFIEKHFNSVNLLDHCVFLSEKYNQFPLAEQAGFRVPKSLTLRTESDLDNVASLNYPVIVKPVAEKTRGQFHSKTELYENHETLKESLLPFLKENGVELLAQEFVAGSDENVRFFFASCGNDGEPRLWLSGSKIRQNPPGRGVMASGVVDNAPNLSFIEKSKTLCRLFGLKGFIGIECKYNETTGEYCYIESSLRPDGYNSIGFAAGVDIVFDSYLAALGILCEVEQPQTFKGVWADMELELGTMKMLRQQDDSSWKHFFKRLPRPIAWAYFTWDDPLPWCCQTLRLLGRIPAKLRFFI
ncbi:hypothetical protein FACS18942_06220 [Planctomycetales bacterium]|nr:hypothetical protein FACS18942_06220 [Planctomycetales bacterium]